MIEVDPAYPSVIRAVNHARRHRIGSRQGVAYAVARKAWGSPHAHACEKQFSLVCKGGHLAFARSASNRMTHVWSFWPGVRG
ncbi:hypothetical protein MPNT_10439 [Candidatus Methylacidithermus pantelleriae]|uniref:Uncharacterized protein n=1 Tax=Candidatus Methylacidithermus pantelleriae TaxID=2744239 RepID=A0A8J2FV65_9BACT|nr:hypothetical protein MPNT_10439 [Candidatus Methylacidithermus pantelleriae]